MEKSEAERLHIAHSGDLGGEAVRPGGFCVLGEGAVCQGEDQPTGEDDGQPGGGGPLPAQAVAHVCVGFRREHGDDEEEEHHHGASVDEHLDGGDEDRLEREEEEREAQQIDDQAEHAVDGVAEEDDAERRGDGDERQHEEGELLRGHGGYFSSPATPVSCGSAVSPAIMISVSAGRSPWPTAAAEASSPSKKPWRPGSGVGVSSGAGAAQASSEPRVALPSGSKSCSL